MEQVASDEGATVTAALDSIRTAGRPKRARAAAMLAMAVTVGFFGSLAALLVVPLPTDSREALMLMIGALIACFNTVIGFYFGSSVGSKTKDDTINSLSQEG